MTSGAYGPNHRREALVLYVRANPGACLSEAARATGIPKSSTLHHVTMLKRQGLLWELRRGRCSRLLSESHTSVNVQALMAQRDAHLSDLLGWLQWNPNLPQKEVLSALEASGWSRSTTQYRLRRLVDAGLVSTSVKGRSKFYRPIGDLAQPAFAYQGLPTEAGFEQALTLSTEDLVKT